jgi:hypothetical protein
MESSILVDRLMAGGDPNMVATEELPKWVKSDIHTLPDLVDRRGIEIGFFNSRRFPGGANQSTLFLLDQSSIIKSTSVSLMAQLE